MSDTNGIFICSFCEKPVRLKPEILGKRGKCPACGKPVTFLDNQGRVIDDQLSTTWHYKAPKLIVGIQIVGPISDAHLIDLIDDRTVDGRTDVMSPEVTKGEWVQLSRIKIEGIKDRITQRIAEKDRRYRLQERKKQADRDNREKLKRGIQSAIESGAITSNHRKTFAKFATAAGIPQDDVEQTIREQSTQALRDVFEEALEDGILEPREEKQISQLAISLGVDLGFLQEEETRISLCRLAYELDSGAFEPSATDSVPFKMAAKESLLASERGTWFEIVTLKRPAGIPLGGDNYLKEITKGMAYLTTKQLSVVGEFQSKKFTFTSVYKVNRYADGILFNRSSGKSVFLKIDQTNTRGGSFGLIGEYACSGEPVLGRVPEQHFIPAQALAEQAGYAEPSSVYLGDLEEPRYTFRVVGDFVGNRQNHISRLSVGDEVLLIREPSNPHDPNAVSVNDRARNMLGYLKRDVAQWFGPMLDRKGTVRADVHTFSSGGSLIVGVYI